MYVEKVELVQRPVCPTCSEEAIGRFCAKCGEQIQLRPDYSFRGLISETLNVVTNLESNIFRSFAFLVIRPGLLTAEYFAGRRKRYLKPLQLFIFCNVIFFFVQGFTGYNSLRTPLRVHLYMMPYSRLAQRKVRDELVRTQVSLKDYESKFNATIETEAKTLVFVMIPMFAAGLSILYLKKKEYFVKHIVFSTHFFAFYLLLLSTCYLLMRLTTKVLSIESSDRVFTELTVSGTILISSFIYLLIAGNRAYQQTRLNLFLRTIALIGILAVVVQLFRFLLFFAAFYSV